jgi:hypothetical protein
VAYRRVREASAAASVDRTCTAAANRSSNGVESFGIGVLLSLWSAVQASRSSSSIGVHGFDGSGVTGEGGEGGGMAGNCGAPPGPSRYTADVWTQRFSTMVLM